MNLQRWILATSVGHTSTTAFAFLICLLQISGLGVRFSCVVKESFLNWQFSPVAWQGSNNSNKQITCVCPCAVLNLS